MAEKVQKVKHFLQGALSFASDIFTLVAQVMGIALVIDILFPIKLGVFKRIVEALATLGVSPQSVVIGVVALMVLIYSKK